MEQNFRSIDKKQLKQMILECLVENPILLNNFDTKPVDVSNIFVCVYNEDRVGLFRKSKGYYNGTDWLFDESAVASVYIGVNSNYIGAKLVGSNEFWLGNGRFVHLSEDEGVHTNCVMSNGMSFDDARAKMYADGLISGYRLGVASESEFPAVIDYVSKYYGCDQISKGKNKSSNR